MKGKDNMVMKKSKKLKDSSYKIKSKKIFDFNLDVLD
jgi:hypothetical protein